MGFGFDPVFLPSGSARSLGELTLEEKCAVSHRGEAMRKFAVLVLGTRRSLSNGFKRPAIGSRCFRLARIHSHRHGKSHQTRPTSKRPPSWLTYSADEVSSLTIKLGKEGLPPQ